MIYVVTAAFVLIDLLTGIVKSFKSKNYTSSLMREGLYHKVGSVLCILFGSLVDYAQTMIDLGVSVPVAASVCTYIILMECGSIIENLCEINPHILPDKLKGYFAKLSGKE